MSLREAIQQIKKMEIISLEPYSMDEWVEREKVLALLEPLVALAERRTQQLQESRKLNQESIIECEKTLKQEHFDSMTPEQRNAQAYAVFSALEGLYKEVLEGKK